jgi:hypothetical protein
LQRAESTRLKRGLAAMLHSLVFVQLGCRHQCDCQPILAAVPFPGPYPDARTVACTSLCTAPLSTLVWPRHKIQGCCAGMCISAHLEEMPLNKSQAWNVTTHGKLQAATHHCFNVTQTLRFSAQEFKISSAEWWQHVRLWSIRSWAHT